MVFGGVYYYTVPLSHHRQRSRQPKSSVQHRPQDVQRPPVAPPPRAYSPLQIQAWRLTKGSLAVTEQQRVHRQAPPGGSHPLQGACESTRQFHEETY